MFSQTISADQAKRYTPEGDTSKGLRLAARAGFAAKGVVYTLVGIIAILAAWGGSGASGPSGSSSGGSEAEGAKGALEMLMRQPFGEVILGLVAAGLIFYALYRFFEAAADPDGQGSDAKGIAARAGAVISGASYGFLAYFAISLLLNLGASGGSGGQQGGAAPGWFQAVMEQPFGIWLAAALGLAIMAVGAIQFYRAYTRQFEETLSPMTPGWAQDVSAFGIVARGVIFLVIGGFAVIAAIQADPSQAVGLSGAMGEIRDTAWGDILFALVAAGLLAYAVYCFTEARFRIVRTESGEKPSLARVRREMHKRSSQAKRAVA
jgi:hypothetical protein